MLVSSMDANTTRLWLIRSSEVTIWIFVLSAGFGQFANGKVSAVLLLLGVVLPFFFVFIDRRLNLWYLYLKTRTEAIARQINDESSNHHCGRLAPGLPAGRPPAPDRSGVRSPTSSASLAQTANLMDESEHDVLAYLAFPAQHRTKLHSTNPLERLNKEVKRRADVVGIFPNEPAIVRLDRRRPLEQHDEWQLQHRYMQLEAMTELATTPGRAEPLQLPPKAA